MKQHLKWNGFTSYSSEGDTFILGMQQTYARFAMAGHELLRFLRDRGIPAWYAHDGWVKDGFNYCSFGIEKCNLTWIEGYNDHQGRCPQQGERLAMIRSHPAGDEKSMTIHIYEVERYQGPNEWGPSPKLFLIKKDTRYVRFNTGTDQYEWLLTNVRSPNKIWTLLSALLYEMGYRDKALALKRKALGIGFKNITRMGMELEEWTYLSCRAEVGVGDDFATVYYIESGEKGKGHATTLLAHMKDHYSALGKDFGGSVALTNDMRRLYTKLKIKEYEH